jgi:hypothetical protein
MLLPMDKNPTRFCPLRSLERNVRSRVHIGVKGVDSTDRDMLMAWLIASVDNCRKYSSVLGKIEDMMVRRLKTTVLRDEINFPTPGARG